MSSGAKVISAFIRETVAGTTPASGDWSLLKRTSWGVKPTQNKGENNEIGGSRMAQGATPGTVDVGGDVGTKFRWGQHDDFLASCFGAEWSGDSLTMGNERITFSLATYASDVGIASVIRGAQVGSWKMQIPNDGDITATVTFAGLDWESKADDTNFITGEPVDSAGELRYSFKEVSAVSLNGVAGGNPKTVAQYQLTKNFDVIWLFSEDGRNWYEEVSNFQKDTIKMAYDENNIIVAITRDASTLNPAGLSVVEVADITANRRADDSGQWMYLDGQVRKREYSSEEVNRQTEQRKATLLSEADAIIRLLERSVRLNMATEEERTRLSAWERYSVLLSRVDSANPEWPQKPEQ